MKITVCAVFLLSLAAALPLSAESIRFRSGQMLCAELSRQKPAGIEISPEKMPWLPEERLYAALTVVPDEGRGISIHDYKLHAFGQDYPCIALLNAADSTSRSSVSAAEAGANQKYTMYFVVNGALLGMKDRETIALRAVPVNEKYQDQQVVFDNRRSRALTSPYDIPRTGKMITAK